MGMEDSVGKEYLSKQNLQRKELTIAILFGGITSSLLMFIMFSHVVFLVFNCDYACFRAENHCCYVRKLCNIFPYVVLIIKISKNTPYVVINAVTKIQHVSN